MFEFGANSVQRKFKKQVLLAAAVEAREDAADGLWGDIEIAGDFGAIEAIAEKYVDQ